MQLPKSIGWDEFGSLLALDHNPFFKKEYLKTLYLTYSIFSSKNNT